MLKLLTLSEDQPAWPTNRQTPAHAVDAVPSLLLQPLIEGLVLLTAISIGALRVLRVRNKLDLFR